MSSLKVIVYLSISLIFFSGTLYSDDAESTATRLDKAVKFFEEGLHQKAVDEVSQVLEKNPKDSNALYLRARMYKSREQYQKAVEDYSTLLEQLPEKSDFNHYRAVCYFNLGEFKKSVADFDRYIEKNPTHEPRYWQRGISHYYAKMFKEGRKQFEVHQTVNSQDVENAVWHFLCVARDESIEKAKEGLIEIQADTRIPMMKVHELFTGSATVDDVLKQAEKGAGKISEEKLKIQRFYAHLYLGLYYEAYQKMDLAKKHIQLAATKYSVPGYMGDVARVHHREYQKQEKKTK